MLNLDIRLRKRLTELSVDRKSTNILIMTLGVAGSLLLWLSLVQHGVGITPDSVQYISGAYNLRAGLGYSTSIVPFESLSEIEAISAWPPFYSVLLALLPFKQVEVSALILNLITFAGIIITVSYGVLSRSGSVKWALIAGLAIMVSSAVVGVHSYALSEPLFILLVLLCLLAQERYSDNPTKSLYLWLVVTAALIPLTRYVGISVVFSSILVILVAGQLTLRKRLILSAIFTLLSTLPFWLWLYRNYLLTRTLTGGRAAGKLDFSMVIDGLYTTFSQWFVPAFLVHTSYGGFFSLSLLLLGLITFGWMWHKGLILKSHPPHRLTPYLFFLVTYPTFLLAAFALTQISSDFDTRLLSPLLPVLVILIASFFSSLDRVSIPVSVVACIILLILFPLLNTLQHVAYANFRLDGHGYRAAKWRKADIISYLQQDSSSFANNQIIYSNAADVLYLYTHRNTRWLPEFSADQQKQTLYAFHARSKSESATVIIVCTSY